MKIVKINLMVVMLSIIFIASMLLFEPFTSEQEKQDNLRTFTYVIDTKVTICENYGLYTYNLTDCSNKPLKTSLFT